VSDLPTLQELLASGAIDEKSKMTMEMHFPFAVGADSMGGVLSNTAKLLKDVAAQMSHPIEVYVAEVDLKPRGFAVTLVALPIVASEGVAVEAEKLLAKLDEWRTSPDARETPIGYTIEDSDLEPLRDALRNAAVEKAQAAE
jgi:hypothetical protein